MRALSTHLDAINDLLPALHDGFFVESYNGSTEELVIVGTQDISLYRDLVITCKSPHKVSFQASFGADTLRFTEHQPGYWVLEILEEQDVMLSIQGGSFTFESDHI